jgi:HEAT repeat protein
MFRTAFALTLFSVLAASSTATDKLGGGPTAPWESLERALMARGFDTSPPALMRLARSGAEASDRWFAIEILGLRQEVEAVPLLRELLATEQDPLLHETVALALARRGDEKGLQVLRESLHSRDEWPRRLYLAARLAELGDLSGYQYVIQAAQAEVADRRVASIPALVAIVPFAEQLSPDPVSLLLDLGRDENVSVRREVLIHLPIVVENSQMVAVFCSLITELAEKDADPGVREMAVLSRKYGAFQSCGEGETE